MDTFFFNLYQLPHHRVKMTILCYFLQKYRPSALFLLFTGLWFQVFTRRHENIQVYRMHTLLFPMWWTCPTGTGTSLVDPSVACVAFYFPCCLIPEQGWEFGGEGAKGPFWDLKYSSWDTHSGVLWGSCVLICWSLIETYWAVTAAEGICTAGVSGYRKSLCSLLGDVCVLRLLGEKASPV